jgi:hypothetical protein
LLSVTKGVKLSPFAIAVAPMSWKLFDKLTSEHKKSYLHDSSVAILDASIIYGAARWYRSVHNDPTWEYGAQYKAAQDRLLFVEFLHDLLLYDRIVLDSSSIERNGWELDDLRDSIRKASNTHLVHFDRVAPEVALEDVVNAVCRLLKASGEDHETNQLLLSTPVPWYYHIKSHRDHRVFESAAHDWGLDERLIPLAIFTYRGICYSGYSRHVTKERKIPTAYLASPGRVKALSPIFDNEAMRLFKYPREAYQDLVDLLDLPPRGYSFSHLPFPEISKLTGVLYESGPAEAVSLVCRLRHSKEAVDIREKWSARICESSATCSVGSTNANVVSNSTVYGNVFQTMTIAAADD